MKRKEKAKTSYYKALACISGLLAKVVLIYGTPDKHCSVVIPEVSVHQLKINISSAKKVGLASNVLIALKCCSVDW